jgi:hypothetical protein
MKTAFQSIKEEFSALDTSDKQLRKFGLLVGGIILLAVGALGIFTTKEVHYTLPAVGFALVGLGTLAPSLLRYAYFAWMGIAIVLGGLIAPLVLAILFFVVLTPIGLLKKLFKDKTVIHAETYWRVHSESQDPKHMEELF